MKTSDINPMPQFFDRFTNLVTDVELRSCLKIHNGLSLRSIQRVMAI
jgi:hypothetical protein